MLLEIVIGIIIAVLLLSFLPEILGFGVVVVVLVIVVAIAAAVFLGAYSVVEEIAGVEIGLGAFFVLAVIAAMSV